MLLGVVLWLTTDQQLRAVRENANYLRKGLMGLNLRVIGDIDSPVICVMLVCAQLCSASCMVHAVVDPS